MRSWLYPETVFFLGVWLLLAVGFRDRGFRDPGALWHVRVGELILTTGLLRTDPFSYTFADAPWIPQQWAAEVILALLHRWGGFDTLLTAFATGLALLYTLVFRRARAGGMGSVLAALVVGGCLLVGAFHYYVRPHLATIALLAWTMACVLDFEAGRCSPWRLAGLVPLFVIWTNLHGGVLGGLLTLGLALAGWGLLLGVNRLRPGTARTPITDWRTAGVLVGVGVACLLTPLVNPFGPELIRTWYRLVGSPVLKEVIHEHRPLDPGRPTGQAVLGLVAVYLLLLAGAWPRLRVGWLLPLVWFGLSLTSIRHGPLFAVVTAMAITDLWRQTVWHRWLVRYGDGSLATDTPPATPGTRWAALPAVVVLVALACQAARLPLPVLGAGWVRFDRDFVPVDLNPVIDERVNRPGVRVFNDANLGGYLIYFAPQARIFMDDRCELYGDEWIDHYADVVARPAEQLAPVFDAWSQRYGFDFVLLSTRERGPRPAGLEHLLRSRPEQWREVARGQGAVLFERVR